MRRVARRVVVFTCDTSDSAWRRRFWLTRDYLPEIAELLVGRPSLTDMPRAIEARMEAMLVPWDCADAFFEAYWRRPEAYPDVPAVLRRFLRSGRRRQRYQRIRAMC